MQWNVGYIMLCTITVKNSYSVVVPFSITAHLMFVKLLTRQERYAGFTPRTDLLAHLLT